jgi:tRNA pseudouridine55 synthase/H/ACA ribonucleoprotein complex subunit 4
MLGCHVGHSGTLDPQVSGVLLVMLGNAVRLAPHLLRHDKEYICLMRLHRDIQKERVEKITGEFTGKIYQRPPRKSAVKRSLRIRSIHRIEILGYEKRLILFRVHCDAGTYIRSLCHHMGLALGVGAHMQELRRTRSGPFDEERSHSLHDMSDACSRAVTGDPTALHTMIMSVDTAVPDLPNVTIHDRAIDAVCHGAKLTGVGVISSDPFKKDDNVAIVSRNREFVGLGRALVSSSEFSPGKPGFVVAPVAVFLKPGTYPRGWKKRVERKDKTPALQKG